MRAMILAAGRGERMGALTTRTPKPLLRVGECYLIDYAINALKQAGIKEIVINVSYCAEQIKTALGDGSRYEVNILYSEEEERLETGGGIFKALPLLSDEFIVISSDVIFDYPLNQLRLSPDCLAHLVMVDNPVYHPRGDFGIEEKKIVTGVMPTFTFGNIGLYHKALFVDCKPGHFRLTNVLLPAIAARKISGEHYRGMWYNVGTPADLAEVTQQLVSNHS